MTQNITIKLTNSSQKISAESMNKGSNVPESSLNRDFLRGIGELRNFDDERFPDYKISRQGKIVSFKNPAKPRLLKEHFWKIGMYTERGVYIKFSLNALKGRATRIFRNHA